MKIAEVRKFVVALGMVVTVLAKALSDGHIDGGELTEIIITALGAFGVFHATNATTDTVSENA